MAWLQDELQQIAAADDLHVAPFRDDGKTCGTPTWVWCVAVGGSLYARAYNGTASRWYQAASRQGGGRITAAGKIWDVTFEPIAGALDDRIDAAYRQKYAGSPYVESMVGARARAATVRIEPRSA